MEKGRVHGEKEKSTNMEANRDEIYVTETWLGHTGILGDVKNLIHIALLNERDMNRSDRPY